MTKSRLRIAVLAGGVGGAKFGLGLRNTDVDVDVIVNNGDDFWLAGLRICPDLDSVMYAFAGVNDKEQGWGRANESKRVSAELSEWGVGWPWFTLGDLDIAAHVARTSLLREGLSLTAVTQKLSSRWNIPVRILPATNDEVETHVVLNEDEEPIHFEEWWVRTRAAQTPIRFLQKGLESSRATDEAVEALATADIILIAPSNPVVSIGTILEIPGIRAAIAQGSAPVVGVSPVIGGAVFKGMADVCLRAIGVQCNADAIARHYGARKNGGLLDGWILDSSDAQYVPGLEKAGIQAHATNIIMSDDRSTQELVKSAIDLASKIAG